MDVYDSCVKILASMSRQCGSMFGSHLGSMNTRFCGSKFGASGIASVLSATIGTSGTPVCGNHDCIVTEDMLHFN